MIIIPSGNLLVQKRGQWTKEPFHFFITKSIGRRKDHQLINNGNTLHTAISLLTVGETKILSLTSQGSVTNTTFKPPLEHPQWLGKGSRYIYKYLMS